jgi:hypothetical protein
LSVDSDRPNGQWRTSRKACPTCVVRMARCRTQRTKHNALPRWRYGPPASPRRSSRRFGRDPQAPGSRCSVLRRLPLLEAASLRQRH